MAWIDQPDTDTGANTGSTTLGDIAKTVGASALSTGAGLAASGQLASAKTGDVGGSMIMAGVQRALQGTSEEMQASKTPGGKAAETDFWGHPVGYLATQLGSIAPVAAATMVPGGLPAQLAVGAGLQTSQVANDAATKINSFSDDELRKEAPAFDQMLKQGMDPQEARAKLLSLAVSSSQLLSSGAVGAAGMGGLGAAMKGVGATGSRILNIAKGAAETGAGMGLMTGQANVASQQQNVAMGSQKDVDWSTAIAEGMLTGGKWAMVGGGLGVLHKSGVQVTGPTPGDMAEAGTLKAQLENTPSETPVPPAAEATQPVKPPSNRPADAPVNNPDAVPHAPSTPGGFRANPQPPPQGRVRPEVDENPPAAPSGEGGNTATRRDYGKDATDQRKAPEGTVDQTAGPAGMDKAVVQTITEQPKAPQEAPQQVVRPVGPKGVDDVVQAAQKAMEPPPPTPEQLQAAEALRMVQEMEAKKKPAPPPPDQITDEIRQQLAQHEQRPTAPPPEPMQPQEAAPAPRLQPKFEAPQEPPGRVLPDLTNPPEFQPLHKQDVVPLETRATIEQEMAGERQPNEPKAPQTVDRVRVAKQNADAKAAEKLFLADRAPPEKETPPQLRQRLAATLDDAQKAGINIPGRVRDTTPNHLMWLKEVKDLNEAMKNGKLPIDRIKQFKADERAAVQGEWDQMRERRIGEGARDIGTGIEEGMGEEKLGEVPSLEPTPEEQLIAKEARGTEDAGEPGLGTPAPDDTLERRQRARREGFEPAVQQKPKFTPKVEKIVKGRRKPVVVERPAEPEPEPPLTPHQQKLADDYIRANVAKPALPNIPAPPVPTPLQKIWTQHGDDPAQPIRMTLKDGLSSIPEDDLRAVVGPGAPMIRDRIASIAGHLPLDIVNRDAMASVSGSPHAVGLYEHITNSIGIRADKLKDRLDTAHIIMHEGVHAALTQTLYKPENAQHLLALHEIRNFVLRSLTQDERKQFSYALQVGQRAFVKVDEFLAEAFSNSNFRYKLSQIKISDGLAQRWGLPNKTTVWQALIENIRKFLNLPENHYTALEAVMQRSEPLWQSGENIQAGREPLPAHIATGYSPMEERAISAVRDPQRAAESTTEDAKYVERLAQNISDHMNATTKAVEVAFKLRTNDQIRQGNEHLFGDLTEKNPLRRLTDTVEKMGQTAVKYEKEGNALTNDIHRLQREYEGDRGWQQFTRLIQDAQVGNFHPDKPLDDPSNKHLGKDLLAGSQGRAMHPGTSARWRALPKDLQELWGHATKYFTDTQDQLAKGILRNILDHVSNFPAGSDLDKIAKRIFEDGLEENDKKFFSPEVYDALDNAKELQKIKGAYFPLMRRGDHVVTAEHEIKLPAGVTKLDNGDIQFKGPDARKRAMDFVAQQKVAARARGTWVDATTGSNKHPDGTRVAAQDPNSEQRFNVRVESRHVEFFEKEHQAIARARELENTPGIVKGSITRQLRKDNPNIDHQLASGQVRTLIKSLEQAKDVDPADKDKMVQALREASIKMTAGNRVEGRALPRRNVKGASDDLLRNTIDYTASTANYRARIDYQPKIGDLLNNLRDQAFKNVVPGARDTIRKQLVVREFEQRLEGYDAQRLGMQNSPMMRNVMELTFLKAMMSPAHLMLHMTHPWMISTPVLAARHGYGRAMMQLVRAYNDMGGRGIMGAGLSGSAKFLKEAVKGNVRQPTDLLTQAMQSIAKTKDGDMVNKMLQELRDTGHIHPDAGWELPRMTAASTKLGRGLGYVDGWFRELTSMTETMNRVGETVAAYRMEMERNGGNHKAAVRYAKDTLANTQGLYSRTNAAPIFRGKLRPLLQFKQFPQMMYNLLARNAYLVFKGESPEVKIEAAKALGGVILTHAAMAGALGLPMEPIKAAVMLANAFGISHTTWDDLERELQAKVSNSLGPQMAEYLMHGMSRFAGVDVHHRLGLNSLLIPFEPTSYTAKDEAAWLADTMMGAPVGTGLQMMDGMHDMMQGDFVKGAAKLIPSKGIDDVIKAVQEGQQGAPMGGVARRAIGFVPSSVANVQAAKRSYYRENEQLRQTRAQLGAAWQSGRKGDVIRQVNQWNSDHPNDKITLNSVASYARMLQERAQSPIGIAETRRNTERIKELERTFNTGG